MSIIIRTRPRRSHLVGRLLHRARVILGGVLLVGAATTGPAMFFLVPVYLIAAMVEGSPFGGAAGALARVWAVTAVIAVSGWTTGRYLMRTRRGMVLWLRRFRYDDAARVVSSALDYIGRSWRVVTLDDAATRPVGVSRPLRLSAASLDWMGRTLPRVEPVLISVGKVAGVASLVGLVAISGWALFEGRVEELLAAMPWRGGSPADSTQTFLIWIFGGVLLAEAAALVAFVVVPLASLPLLGWAGGFNSLREAVRRGEATKAHVVATPEDLATAWEAIAEASEHILGPRLTVVTVENQVWRQAVTVFGRQAAAVVIDVSRPTDHLVWEVDEMTRITRTPPVFVGRNDRLLRMTGATPSDEVDPRVAARFDHLRGRLEGQEVLSYTTTISGKLRFQKALLAELEERFPRTRWGWRDIRRAGLAVVGLAAFMLGVGAAVVMVTSL